MENKKNAKSSNKSDDFVQIDFVNNPQGIATYINHAQIQFSNYDVAIMVGELVGKSGETIQVMPKARLSMSLQFFQEFAELIRRNHKQFEKQFQAMPKLDLSNEDE